MPRATVPQAKRTMADRHLGGYLLLAQQDQAQQVVLQESYMDLSIPLPPLCTTRQHHGRKAAGCLLCAWQEHAHQVIHGPLPPPPSVTALQALQGTMSSMQTQARSELNGLVAGSQAGSQAARQLSGSVDIVRYRVNRHTTTTTSVSSYITVLCQQYRSM